MNIPNFLFVYQNKFLAKSEEKIMDDINTNCNSINNDYEAKKDLEKLRLKNISSGIGFAIIIEVLLSIFLFGIITFITDGASEPFYFAPIITSRVLYYIISSMAFILSIFLPFYFAAKSFKIDFSDLLPFNRVKGKTLVCVIILGFAACICANYLADLFVSGLNFFGVYPELPNAQTESEPAEFIMLTFYTTLCPALVEEFAFRGVCLGAFRKFGDGFAIIMSSILFALLHGNLLQIPFAFLVGIVFGYIAVKLNSLLPCIIIHFLNNLYSVIINEIGTHMELPAYSLLCGIFGVVFIFAGIFALIYLIKKDKSLFVINKSSSLLSTKEKMKYSICNVSMICTLIILICLMLISLV